MKIALFYRVWFESGEEFLAAAQKLGVELMAINYQDLILQQTKDQFEIVYQGQPLSQFDLFYFRAVGAAQEWADILVRYAQAKKIPLVDEYLAVWGPSRRLKSISGLILGQNGVAYPQTSLAFSEEQILKEAEKFGFPFVLKVSKGGRHGIGTLLIKDKEQLERVLKGRVEKSSFLLQEYIPNDGDYRVFLVGYQVLGAFKRQPKEEKLTLNQSVGPSRVLKEVPAAVKALAEKAARVLKVEVGAVDLVIDERTDEPVIIEVNEAPEFKVMKKRTGIEVAEEILKYLVQKAKKADLG